MKNKIILVILAILMFVPSVVAVVSFFTTKDTGIVATNADTVSIRDTEGVVYTFEKGKDKDAETMIEVFTKMESGAVECASIPDAVAMSKSFTVTCSIANRTTEYKYFLSNGAENAYYMSAQGKAFHIKESDAAEFLKTAYAQSIYNQSKVPELLLSGEYKISPATATWMYVNTTGEFVAADTSALIAKAPQQLSLEGGLALEFSIEPDLFDIEIKDDKGEVIYDDLFANIGSLRLDEGAKISVVADAKWYEDKDREYYGELTYNFNATVSAPAEFYPGVTTAEVGEFMSLTGINVKNPEKINFTSKPDIGYTPVFVTDEENPQYVRALVPFDVNLTPGTYELTLSYAGTTQTIGIKLTGRTINTRDYNIDKAMVTSYFTDSAKTAFKNETSDIAKEVTGTKQWDGYFYQVDAPITMGFGHVRKITSADASYNHPGVDYSLAAGEDVLAANSGTVVFSGILELTGYTVVIDHGFGLKTWYWHMSETSVKVGDTVKKEDVVGKTGKTGFTNQNGVHVGMSVCDVFVSPYSTWSDGDWKDVPMYNGENK